MYPHMVITIFATLITQFAADHGPPKRRSPQAASISANSGLPCLMLVQASVLLTASFDGLCKAGGGGGVSESVFLMPEHVPGFGWKLVIPQALGRDRLVE